MDKEGNKTGGRKAGTPNKETLQLLEIAEKHGCNPFEVLILFAKRDHVALGLPEYTIKVIGKGENATEIEELTISPELQQKSAKDAAEYLYAKRKAVEFRGEDDKSAVVFQLSYADK
jgi:hypothetical protein